MTLGTAAAPVPAAQAAPAAAAPLTVVNIISHSYSGSTWMNLTLGAHPEAFSVGEFKWILQTRPVCSQCGEGCPVWSAFDPASAENPFLQLQRLTGRRVLIVNNSRKLIPAQRHLQIKSVYIHLVRDGRAVTASVLRKWPATPMWRAALKWRHDVRRNLRLMKRQDPARATQVIYEQATASPEAEFARLCALIGMDWRPEMLRYWERPHHSLGGNVGALLGLARKQGSAPAPALQENVARHQWDLSYYEKSDPAHFVDERWKSELSRVQLLTFGLLAGRLNRHFGYRACSRT